MSSRRSGRKKKQHQEKHTTKILDCPNLSKFSKFFNILNNQL